MLDDLQKKRSCRTQFIVKQNGILLAHRFRSASVCGFLHLSDNSVTTAIRELPNLTTWEVLAAGHRIKQAALHPGAFEHATTHQQFDIALFFV